MERYDYYSYSSHTLAHIPYLLIIIIIFLYLDNQSLFGDEVSPLLSQYIKEKEQLLFDQNNLTNLFFLPSPKVALQFPFDRTIGINLRIFK